MLINRYFLDIHNLYYYIYIYILLETPKIHNFKHLFAKNFFVSVSMGESINVKLRCMIYFDREKQDLSLQK